MKVLVLAARILLGLIFFVFGINDIKPFMHLPLPSGDALSYMSVLSSHGVFTVVGLCMVIAGVLLLVGRFVPLALTLLGPIIVNIVMYHVLIDPAGGIAGSIPAIIVTFLEVFLIVIYRRSFYTLFYPAPEAL
jgi:uncharacterized membrane protein YphA (DoxX/SURF4 family)